MNNTYIITNKDIHKRLDVFLTEKLAKFSRGDIIRAIKNGDVLCNNKIPKPSYKLETDDKIIVKKIDKQLYNLISNKNIPLDIIFENDDFLILNKQRGIQVHPSTTEKKYTITNALIAKYPQIKDVGDDKLRPGIVHRLDKYTSGLMVIAKNQKTFDLLKENFSNRKINKTYITLVWGKPKELVGKIDAPIARAMGYTKQKVVLNNSGSFKGEIKEAITNYKTLKSFKSDIKIKNQNYKSNKNFFSPVISLLEVKPKTGRMHQIRVHMRHINTPIIGDVKYETKNFKELRRKVS